MTSIPTFLKKINAKLLFTDLDSLTYKIKSEDVYEDFYKDKHLFDLSNYTKMHSMKILMVKNLIQ